MNYNNNNNNNTVDYPQGDQFRLSPLPFNPLYASYDPTYLSSVLIGSLDRFLSGFANRRRPTPSMLSNEQMENDGRLKSRLYVDALFFVSTGLKGLSNVLNPAITAISSFSQSLINFSKSQFIQSATSETEDIQSIGSIQAAAKNKLSFEESYAVFLDAKDQLAKIAAVLPFETADYVQTFKLAVDSVTQGIIEKNPNVSKEELTTAIKEQGVEASKLLTLQAKTTNTSPKMSAKVMGQFLGGHLNLQSDLFQANPVFKDKIIEESVKLGGKKTATSVNIKGLTTSQRYQAFVSALRKSISQEMLNALEGSFNGAVEGLKALLMDNTVGILGFSRRFESVGKDALSGKEITTFFQAISSILRPVIKGITNVLDTVVTLFDPLRYASENLLAILQDWAISIDIFGSVFNSQLEFLLGQGKNKMAAAQEAFSIAFKNSFGIELAAETITFDSVWGMVENWLLQIIHKLGDMLQIETYRDKIKDTMIFSIRHLVIPYFRLMMEAIVEVVKKDPIAGSLLAGVVFAPLIKLLFNLGIALTGAIRMLTIFGSTQVAGAATGIVAFSWGTVWAKLVAVVAGIGTFLTSALFGYIVLGVASLAAIAVIVKAILTVVEILKILNGGKTNNITTNDIVNNQAKNREVETQAKLAKETNPQKRAEIMADKERVDRRMSNYAKLMAEQDKKSVFTSIFGKDEKDNQAELAKLYNQDLPRSSPPVPIQTLSKSGRSFDSSDKKSNSTSNSTTNNVTNNFTVNTTEDAETVAKALLVRFQGALGGLAGLT